MLVTLFLKFTKEWFQNFVKLVAGRPLGFYLFLKHLMYCHGSRASVP